MMPINFVINVVIYIYISKHFPFLATLNTTADSVTEPMGNKEPVALTIDDYYPQLSTKYCHMEAHTPHVIMAHIV